MLHLTRSLDFSAHSSYVRGTETATGAPPALENGIPPLTGFASLRWQPAGRHFWVEAYCSMSLLAWKVP
ncbi:MAG: hypothetical protein ACR2G5_00435 [Pyrinomonadaceae bacterium]